MNCINYRSTVFWLVLMMCSLVPGAVFAQESLGPMPSFSLESAVDGKSIKSSEFEGKVLLITFFATWCPPCRQEVPTLLKLQDKYKNDFSVLGISVDSGGARVVRAMIDQMHITYPVVMADRNVTKSFGGITGVPTSFLVGKDGQLEKRYLGYIPHKLLEQDISALLRR